MSTYDNWQRCPSCGVLVHAFGVGDNTITFGKETYHAECIDLDDLDSDELIEVGSKEAMDLLYLRDESAYERWISDHYGGSTPTWAERYQQDQQSARELK